MNSLPSLGLLKRWAALGLAGAAAISTALIATAAPANAVPTTLDQITGEGVTDSAVTLSWVDGQTGLDNTPVNGPRDPAVEGYLGVEMFEDFKDLKVTVSQTTGLAAGAVAVTWTGLKASDPNQPFERNYLQLMQCWGDEATGPDPEQCQFGSLGMQVTGNAAAGVGYRAVAGRRPGMPAYPGSPGGLGLDLMEGSFDPAENALAAKHVNPAADGGAKSEVPFLPVGASEPVWGTTSQERYFNKNTSNEIQGAASGADGSGHAVFEIQTATEAPHLGCGRVVGEAARDCWLVVVPRGEHLASGLKHTQSAGNRGLMSSALSATNWAQRLQFRLSFQPVGVFCPSDAVERRMVGSEQVSRLISSYQPVLCADGGSVYGFAVTPDTVVQRELVSTSSGASGIGFSSVEIPRRTGDPELVYAPAAVSGIGFGFSIDAQGGSGPVPELKLTPRLVAKALSQSYQMQVPGQYAHNMPAWASSNPATIAHDPEFAALNGAAVPPSNAWPGLRLMMPVGNAAEYHRVWEWILADPAAKAWLGGAPDEHGMTINPVYVGTDADTIRLDAAALDNFPKSDPTCYHDDNHELAIPLDKLLCTLDLNPYVSGLNRGALQVRRANDGAKISWDRTANAPDGSTGWYTAGSPMGPGVRRNWAVTDTPSATQFGIQMASLCQADGTGCAAPTTTSLTLAVANSFDTKSSGMLVPNGKSVDGAYPLTVVTHAVIRGAQDPAALTAAAELLDYIAGPGQATGVGTGKLPTGYLPLTAQLRDLTTTAADRLRTIAATPPTTTEPSTPAAPPPSSQEPPAPQPSGDPIPETTVETTPVETTVDAPIDPVPTFDEIPTTDPTWPDPEPTFDDVPLPETEEPVAGEPEVPAAAEPATTAAAVPASGDAPTTAAPTTEVTAVAARITPPDPVAPNRFALVGLLIGGISAVAVAPAVMRRRSRTA